MSYVYFIILGIAHVLGDFYFQTERMARKKDEKYSWVLIHSIEYLLVALVSTLPVASMELCLSALLLGLIHWLIDSAKYFLLKKKLVKQSYKVFATDQLAHIISIILLVYIMLDRQFAIGEPAIFSKIVTAYQLDVLTIAKWLLAILIIHAPVNIFIQVFIGGYKPREKDGMIKADKKVGRKIGTIERLIILIFLVTDQYAAIGFVLTAKSIARYDKISKDEKFAEYYLLGTLVSTLSVLICKILIWGL